MRILGRRGLRWFLVALVTVVALGFGAEVLDDYTATRKLDAHQARVGQIRRGMTEAEVVAVAGPPDDPTALGDNERRKQACVRLNATSTSVMAYSITHGGWLSEKLDLPSGWSSTVVCLDGSRRVVDTYFELIHV